MSFKTNAAALVACMLALGVAWMPQDASAQEGACSVSPPLQQTALPRPIPLGVSGGNIHSLLRRKNSGKVKGCFSGTLGSMVEDGDGTEFILSNNHVLAHQNKAVPGQRVIQPGLVDIGCLKGHGNAVATFSSTIDLKFGGTAANTVDAAIAEVDPGDVSPEILFIGGIADSTAAATIGMPVQKMGRTTCLTTGTVAGLGVHVTVNYSDRIRPKLAKFVGQILVTGSVATPTFGAAGDSGSLIVTNTGCPQAVALLFAGTTGGLIIANPIDKVLNQLSVSMVGTCSDAVAPPAQADLEAQGMGLTAAVVESASAVRDRHESALMSIAGAVGTGIGASDQEAGQPAIKVYLDKVTPEAQAAAPKTVEGLPVELVETSGGFNAL